MEGKVTIYRFGDFTLESENYCFKKRGQEIHLRPKAFETLHYLIERPNQLVKKDELLDNLWPDTIVTENTLSQTIDAVRKALEDNAHHPTFIQTIPRLGFKFIANVQELATLETATRPKSDQDGSNDQRTAFPSGLLISRLRLAFMLILLLSLGLTIGFMLVRQNQESFDSLAVLPFVNLSDDPEQDYFADGMTEALIANLAKIKGLRVTHALRS